MKRAKLIDPEEIYQGKDEDYWWKIGANTLLAAVIVFAIVHAIRYFLFIA